MRRNAVMTCILSEDSSVIEPLKEMEDDEDFEVRFYAKQGVTKCLLNDFRKRDWN